MKMIKMFSLGTLVLGGMLLMTGCVSSDGTGSAYGIPNYAAMNSTRSYQTSYQSQPTSYRIKEYHPMNSGMGF